MTPLDFTETILAYYEAGSLSEHSRYRSWEHCYSYFRDVRLGVIPADRDRGALALAFYLASWGMYRGSSFLLQYTYTVHGAVVDLVEESRFKPLWSPELGGHPEHRSWIPLILEFVSEVRESYGFAVARGKAARPTDTLITKIMLGTFGCVPATDEFFLLGFKRSGFSYSSVNPQFLERVFGFSRDHGHALATVQKRIQARSGVLYPLMKLVDMHFWQLGRL